MKGAMIGAVGAIGEAGAVERSPRERVEVAVIGGGQSGLAAAFHLAERGLRHVVLDASPSAGHVWRQRWQGLRLLTPCPYNSLPGTPFPGAAWTFPEKDHVADYLDDYEQRHRLGVRHRTSVQAVRRSSAGVFELELAPADAPATSPATAPPRLIEARAVLVATGPFRAPLLPALAAGCTAPQLHSHHYRSPEQLPPGRVLVVGCGNSGAGIAEQLAASHRVTLSLGRTASSPRALLGRDVFWWAHLVGLTRLPAHWRLARRMQRGPDGLIGASPEELARRHGFELAPRTVAFEGALARFADGTSRAFDAVVWATGYRPDYPLLAPLAEPSRRLFDERGRPHHHQGLTALPGLCFLGLPWQRHIDSSLLGGVGRDAAFLARCLARQRAPVAAPPRSRSSLFFSPSSAEAP